MMGVIGLLVMTLIGATVLLLSSLYELHVKKNMNISRAIYAANTGIERTKIYLRENVLSGPPAVPTLPEWRGLTAGATADSAPYDPFVTGWQNDPVFGGLLRFRVTLTPMANDIGSQPNSTLANGPVTGTYIISSTGMYRVSVGAPEYWVNFTEQMRISTATHLTTHPISPGTTWYLYKTVDGPRSSLDITPPQKVFP